MKLFLGLKTSQIGPISFCVSHLFSNIFFFSVSFLCLKTWPIAFILHLSISFLSSFTSYLILRFISTSFLPFFVFAFLPQLSHLCRMAKICFNYQLHWFSNIFREVLQANRLIQAESFLKSHSIFRYVWHLRSIG